jgi:cell wall-associated NlpC family hydrolase
MFKLKKIIKMAAVLVVAFIAVVLVNYETLRHYPNSRPIWERFDYVIWAAGVQAPSIADNIAIRNAIVDAARLYIGASYMRGEKQPPYRFDCSGLVSQAYLDATGLLIPRSSAQIWAQGRRVTRNAVQPGDIIVFGERGRTTHVAIYVDRTYMIHATSAGPRTGVIESRQDENYWAQRFMGFVSFVGTTTPLRVESPAGP